MAVRRNWTYNGFYILSTILFLVFLANQCKGDFECNFDDAALCGFRQDTRDDMNLLHHSGLTPTTNTGPDGDHTSGLGHYMYLEASGGTQGSVARLISPRFNGGTGAEEETNGVKITVWLSKNGEEMGTFRILMMNATGDAAVLVNTTSTDMEEILSVQGELGNDWVKKNKTIPRPSRDFHIIFEAMVGASAAGDIAFDDVTVTDDIIPVPPLREEFNCTFEAEGLCVFTQDTTDDFNLIKYRASENANQLAMRKDHTIGDDTGKYLSVDAYNYYSWWNWRYSPTWHSQGDVARIISPMLAEVNEGEDPACLLFWYHMHGGDSVGTIRVYVKNETSEALDSPVWVLTGERGSVWRAAEVRIEQPIPFQIVFEFVAGNRENLAIDDVSLSRYECPGEHPVAIHPSIDCDFGEAEMCFYTHDPTGDFNWIWTNRATDSSFTGPAQDHTRGDELGFYVHVDSWGQRPQSKARLISPLTGITSGSSSCVEFWYHMYGSHIGTLNVYMRPDDTAGSTQDRIVWTLSGNQGDTWHRALFPLSDMPNTFRIVFEGILGRFYRTDIAIDDVHYYPNSQCPSCEYGCYGYDPTAEPIPTTLPPGLPGNFSCTFEDDFCNFTQATDDIMDWRRVRANYLQEDLNGWRYNNMHYERFPQWWRLKGPPKDHTIESPDGWLMAFWYRGGWNGPQLVWNDKTRIISPLLSGSTQPRCLMFYLWKQGYTNDYLNVYIQGYGESLQIDPDWALYWRYGRRWWPSTLDIPASDRPFNIVFESVVPGPSKRRSNYMLWAIDDVTVEYGYCPRNKGIYTLTGIPGSCDFEDEDACEYYSWSRFTGGNPSWVRISGETPSRFTGPKYDHTFGNASGHYMYYETSQPVRPRHYGDLSTKRMHLQAKQCVRFYYHASGNDTRRLEFYLREPAQYIYTLLKTVEGKQKNAWLPVNVDIDVTGDFQLVWRAYAGRGYQGDIAIDDVIILPHPCLDLDQEESCDFEMGPDLCKFVNSVNNEVDWKWYDAILGRGFPLLSRSTATNSFMYLMYEAPSTSNSSSQPKTSEIYSGHLTVSPMSGDLCLSLEYFIGGTRKGSVEQTLVISFEEKDGTRSELKSLTGKNMSEWKMYKTSLLQSHELRPFIVYQIVISVPSPSELAVVAFDNFVVSSASCESLGIMSAQKQTSLPNRSGMTAGIVILLIILVAIIAVALFIYRARLQSLVHRFSQSVTELNYKTHDVAFVNEDKKETVEIPSIPTPGAGGHENPVYDESPSK